MPAIDLKRSSTRWAYCVLLGVTTAAAHAQTYPSKPVRMIVPFQAGAGGDVSARLLGGLLGESLGQPIIVENRAGAGESIAAEIVAKAAPDGYTLLYCSSNALVMRPNLAKVVPYDPVRDFAPITIIYKVAAAIVVNPSLPVHSLKELLDYAKANPGKISYGTSGIGTTHHLAGEQIAQLASVHMVHVPYKSGVQPLNDLMAGRIPMTYTIMSTLAPQLKSGKIRVLAVDSETRRRNLPDVPTILEILPGFKPVPIWTGVVAPARVPQPILGRLHGAIIKAIGRPEMQSRLESAGYEVLANSPEEFTNEIKRGLELVSNLVKTAGIQPSQ